ncbi:hypothetical protein B0H34DRAFT_524368 [Crassisporium funariophilum]|nr:hypothetical protein B0H34DRAFT_524368 [Crassisporium funariophilum]
MSLLQWTNPTRRSGTKPLSAIPNEHFGQSSRPWINAVTRRKCSNLAPVCRYFCSVMLPWIFESLIFVGDDSKQAGTSSPNYTSFCRSIVNGSGAAQIMAHHVKRCTFLGWIPDHTQLDSVFKQEFLKLYSKAMVTMLNLDELRLKKVSLNKTFFKAVTSLQRLRRLTLDGCTFPNIPNKDFRKLASLQLTSLSLATGLLFEEETQALVQSFSLDSLLEVRTNNWDFATRFANYEGSLPLETLDLFCVDDVPVLLNILKNTPSLRALRIFSATLGQWNPVLCEASILPVLEKLECPMFLLPSLVPGRPISCIQISPATSLTELPIERQCDVRVFGKSTRPIRALRVPADVYRLAPFWKYFPDLVSLKLEFLHNESDHPIWPKSEDDLEHVCRCLLVGEITG